MIARPSINIDIEIGIQREVHGRCCSVSRYSPEGAVPVVLEEGHQEPEPSEQHHVDVNYHLNEWMNKNY